jgi:AcrR family transcriptional regulator
MSASGSGVVSSPNYRQLPARPRSEGKRTRIVDAAMRHFAEQGYDAARVGDLAATLGIAKGSIFQHFGSKDGLFLEVYKKATRSFRATWMRRLRFAIADSSRCCDTGWRAPSTWCMKIGFLTGFRCWETTAPTSP